MSYSKIKRKTTKGAKKKRISSKKPDDLWNSIVEIRKEEESIQSTFLKPKIKRENKCRIVYFMEKV